jgi:hypothetical protein
MDLTPYIEELQHQLEVAASAGGDEAQRLAERLLPALESASRLVLLDVLSTAASDITSEVAPVSVELRLRGREAEFVVTTPPHEHTQEAPPADAPPAAVAPMAAGVGDAEEAGTSRVTLRLPEPLKGRIEESAARQGLSVNAWLVRTLAAVVEPGASDAPKRHTPSGGERFTGWARS